MSTRLILMATDHQQNTSQEQSTINKALVGSEEQPKPETPKTRGRKSGKGSNQKKQPQRGLGVAQLERLRMEERLMKMNQQQQQALHLLDQYNFQKVQSSPTLSVSDSLCSVPVQYGASSNSNYGVSGGGGGPGPGPVVINSSSGSGTSLFGFERAGTPVVQRIGNGGTRMNPIVVDPNPYGIIGAPDRREKVAANLYETSKELSSMPKMHSSAVVSSDRCDFCCKKKRFNGEISSIGVYGRKEKFSEILPMGGSNIFLGLNEENISSLAGETFGLGAKASRSNGYAGSTIDDHEGAEVLAIHRKGNSYSGSGGGVLMEYEFFPAGKEYGGTFPKEMEILPLEASVPVNGSEPSNHVDLSLKLSY